MSVLSVCLYMHYMRSWCSQRLEEDAGSTRVGVTDACELSCRWWEVNPRPLQEQQVLFPVDPLSALRLLVLEVLKHLKCKNSKICPVFYIVILTLTWNNWDKEKKEYGLVWCASFTLSLSTRHTWEDWSSVEELPSLDWPGGVSVEYLLDYGWCGRSIPCVLSCMGKQSE